MLSLKCPHCNAVMQSGYAQVHDAKWGFFLVGLSFQHLFFKADDQSEIRFLHSGHTVSAYHCQHCDVMVMDKKNTPSREMHRRPPKAKNEPL